MAELHTIQCNLMNYNQNLPGFANKMHKIQYYYLFDIFAIIEMLFNDRNMCPAFRIDGYNRG